MVPFWERQRCNGFGFSWHDKAVDTIGGDNDEAIGACNWSHIAKILSIYPLFHPGAEHDNPTEVIPFGSFLFLQQWPFSISSVQKRPSLP